MFLWAVQLCFVFLMITHVYPFFALHMVTVHHFHQSWKALELQTGAFFAFSFTELKTCSSFLVIWMFSRLVPIRFCIRWNKDLFAMWLFCHMHADFFFYLKGMGKGRAVQSSLNVPIVRGSYISNLVIYLQYFYIFVFANNRKWKQMCVYDSFFSFLSAEVIFPDKKNMNICKLKQN